jgi:hypothetical protein
MHIYTYFTAIHFPQSFLGQFSLTEQIQFGNSVWQISLAIQFGNSVCQFKSVWQFSLAIQSVWQFSSTIQFGSSAIQFGFSSAVQFGNLFARPIRFGNSAIWFGNSVWQNEFDLTIWQFDSAIRFGNSIWHLCVDVCHHGRPAGMFGLNNSIRQFDLAFVCGCLSSW